MIFLPKKKSRGLSLLEAIIYIFIATLIIAVISEIFINQSSLGQKRTYQSDVELNASAGIEVIKTAIQGAGTVVASRTFGGTAYTSDANTLILELPSIDASDDIVVGSYDYVVFFLDPSDPTLLKATTEAAAGSARQSSTRIISSFVSSAEFRYNKVNTADSTSIDATIATEKTLGTQIFSAKATAKVNLRNKQ